VLADAQAVSGTISGFGIGDTIDLTAVAYDPAGSATLSGGTLTIEENGSSYTLQLAGSYIGDEFNVSSAASGTAITVTALPRTSITVSAGQTSSGLTISGLENFYVLSGGTASNTVIQSIGTEYVSSGVTYSTNISSGGTVILSGGVTHYTHVSAGGMVIVQAGSAYAHRMS